MAELHTAAANHGEFCNLVCVYVHKICEDKFGGCKISFSLLGQKGNKKIDVYRHNANDSVPIARGWRRHAGPGKTSR